MHCCPGSRTCDQCTVRCTGAESYLFTLYPEWVNFRGEIVIKRCVCWTACYRHVIDLLWASYKCQMCSDCRLPYKEQQFTLGVTENATRSWYSNKTGQFTNTHVFIFSLLSHNSNAFELCGRFCVLFAHMSVFLAPHQPGYCLASC